MTSGNRDDDDAFAVAETVSSGDESAVSAAPPPSGARSLTSSSSGGPRAVQPGDVLGRYQVGDELGAGGMASVFRARDPELRREVAVKVLFPHLARKPELTRRFQREARAAAGLEHPNILRVYDVGGGADRTPPYIVMELVRGHSLREVAEAAGPMLSELVACIGALVCDALAVAHAAGIVHRDVKPANLMLADDGRLLLADFGVARLDDDDSLVTRTGALLGTPSFMAPEQALGNTVDARSDLYSVGAMLYQLATGSLPYAGPTAKIVTDAAKGGATPAVRRRPAVGGELSRLIERLMAPDPARRPATAVEAAAALRAIVAGGGLGEPVDEVRGFAADRAGWEAARRPGVVARLVARARAARDARALAPAIALLDRALALAPDDADALALADELATPAGGRRRLVAAGAAAVLALGGAGLWMFTRDEAPPLAGAAADDAGASTLVAADAAGGAAAVDAATMTASVLDAAAADAGVVAPAPIDAGAALVAVRARDAGPRLTATTIDAAAPVLAIDAGVAAAPPPIDAAVAPSPAPAHVTFAFDTWCELAIDGARRGRADKTLAVELPAGEHVVVCSQGPGLASWSQTITVAAGQHRRVDGTLLASVEVVIAAGDEVQIGTSTYPRGTTVRLKPNRYRVTVFAGGKASPARFIDIPRLARCTLRAEPDLACYR